MRLAAAGRPEQQQVGSLIEPAVAGAQRRHLRFGDHRHGFEVEVLQCFAGQQLRFAEMAFDAPPIAFGNLVFGQRHQQAGRRPAFLVGALGELLPQVFDRRQPQLVQQQRQACGVDGLVHAASPMYESFSASYRLSGVSCTHTSRQARQIGGKARTQLLQVWQPTGGEIFAQIGSPTAPRRRDRGRDSRVRPSVCRRCARTAARTDASNMCRYASRGQSWSR